jgi:hypothetical protein
MKIALVSILVKDPIEAFKFSKEPTKVDWGIEKIFNDTCGDYVQLYQK